MPAICHPNLSLRLKLDVLFPESSAFWPFKYINEEEEEEEEKHWKENSVNKKTVSDNIYLNMCLKKSVAMIIYNRNGFKSIRSLHYKQT